MLSFYRNMSSSVFPLEGGALLFLIPAWDILAGADLVLFWDFMTEHSSQVTSGEGMSRYFTSPWLAHRNSLIVSGPPKFLSRKR